MIPQRVGADNLMQTCLAAEAFAEEAADVIAITARK